ncbi:MAG: hypothetical protein AAF098_15380 [Pseudomonadota bacterium]
MSSSSSAAFVDPPSSERGFFLVVVAFRWFVPSRKGQMMRVHCRRADGHKDRLSRTTDRPSARAMAMASQPVVFVDVRLDDGINASAYVRKRAEDLGATCVSFVLLVKHQRSVVIGRRASGWVARRR